jgi:multiple sugar transport system ATP-binding protein
MASLTIERLSKKFGTHPVLADVNLSISDGEFLVLVGPSGCGKSTLLSIIAGLDAQSEGSIRIDDKPVDRLEPKARDIAMVFQSYALYPSMSVEQNIAFAMEMQGVAREERKRRVLDVARILQIETLLDRRPSQLSGGQRQRVAMGRALVRNPKIFLFDEPLSNLDAKLRVEMRTEIKKLYQRLGSTIVYVTHDQIEAMTMATRIAVMRGGIIQQFGTPEDIYRRPANTFVATFMGSPSMNLINARLDRPARVLHLHGEGQGIAVPDRWLEHAKGWPDEVIIGVRPESVDLAMSDAAAGLLADVEVVEPTGPDTYVSLRIGLQEIVARLPAGASIAAGDRRALKLDLATASIFNKQTGVALN